MTDDTDNIQTIALRSMEPILGFATLCLTQFLILQWAYFNFPYEAIFMNQVALDNRSYFMATIFITTIIFVAISMWFGQFISSDNQ